MPPDRKCYASADIRSIFVLSRAKNNIHENLKIQILKNQKPNPGKNQENPDPRRPNPEIPGKTVIQ
jgi:hypothetical protein